MTSQNESMPPDNRVLEPSTNGKETHEMKGVSIKDEVSVESLLTEVTKDSTKDPSSSAGTETTNSDVVTKDTTIKPSSPGGPEIADLDGMTKGTTNKSSSSTRSETTNSNGNKSETTEAVVETILPPMNFTIFTFWILPVLILSVFGRHGVNTDMPSIPEMKNRGGPSIHFDQVKMAKAALDYDRKKQEFEDKYRPQSKPSSTGAKVSSTQTTNKSATDTVSSSAPPLSQSTSPTVAPTIDTSSWPSSYKASVDRIHERRSRWQNDAYKGHRGSVTKQERPKATQTSVSPTEEQGASSSRTTQARRTPHNDPQRQMAQEKIAQFRELYEKDKTHLFNAIQYAEAMRLWQQTYFDGGTYDQQAIQVYEKIIQIIQFGRTQSQQRGIPTDVSQSGLQNVPNEVRLPFEEKSLDGLLCAIYTSLGKLYFVANMFEASEEAYNECVEVEPYYLDAVHARGSTRIVLNKYAEAAQDFSTVIVRDDDHLFSDAFTGLVRVLEADEAAVPFGWEFVLGRLNTLIPQFESTVEEQTDNRAIVALSSPLRRFHHAMFIYHERKTKDFNAAWDHLTEAHRFKLNTLPPFPYGSEKAKLDQIKTVFTKDFWPAGMGSSTKAPIFVIGFARCGSTLLERILDAHPQIFGMGENSVFNGNLDNIRQRIVEASVTGEKSVLPKLTEQLAEEVVAEMHRRWRTTDTSSSQERVPERFVDKMLTNFFNIGFLHLLYPNAIILHVIREPMDTVFSSFKHDFPADRLAYTGDPDALAELYNTYRDTMIHWENVLPGRVTHIRYEDLVNDTPGMARAIIEATGLPWDESVLDFHNKKQYVNTFSTTQVRKKIYKDGIQSWKKYERQLQPLVDLLGVHATYDQPTTIPGYTKPDHLQGDEL